jgi:hypothetical protein
VVALKHSEGIKHTVLLQEQEAYKHTEAYNTRPLSFSLVFLSSISHQQLVSEPRSSENRSVLEDI